MTHYEARVQVVAQVWYKSYKLNFPAERHAKNFKAACREQEVDREDVINAMKLIIAEGGAYNE